VDVDLREDDGDGRGEDEWARAEGADASKEGEHRLDAQGESNSRIALRM
jgi:hypothetical protein